MVERMDADRAARLAAAMRSGAVSGGGLEDVAEDWRRARAEEARLHVERDTLESEVAQLRATLAASFGLDAKVEANTAALVERVRELDAKLSAAICDHCDEVEAWQSATGLEVGGDPGGVTPEHLRRFIQAQDERVRRLEEALGALSARVERAVAGGSYWASDHACAECVPWGDALIPGFRCGRHAALALLKEPTP